jgi:predicted methyltransferase MtxX (methanogen marker protein 4)
MIDFILCGDIDLLLICPQGIVFDRRLMEVVSIAFKPADFERMATNDTELIVASSGRAAQALRVAFGLLM